MARTEPFVSAPQDTADLPYQGIGAELRAAREASAQSADLVASTLRIRRPHILAIEEGRFQDLPGQVYAIGFVRAYAEFLHLDGDLAVERFGEEADGPSPKLELHFPEPAARRARLDMRALFVGLIIAVGAYGTWNYVQTRGELPRELVAMVPPNLLVAADDGTVTGTTMIEQADAPGPAETDTVPRSQSSGLGSKVEVGNIAVGTPPAANSNAGLDDTTDRVGLAPASLMDKPAATARSTFDGPASPTATAVRGPDRRLSDGEGVGSAGPVAESPILGQDGNFPPSPVSGTVTVQRLTDDGVEVVFDGAARTVTESDPVPAEDPISALIVAELESESDSQLPPLSDALAGYRLGETVEDEPGSATPVTGALAEAPEAPTLLENALPSVPRAPSVTYEPRVYGQGNIDARVVVRARIESWVQIEGSNNELLLTRVLNAGDMFLVPNRSDLSLVTGNAGGIEILVDGVLMPPLGPEGTVRRNVSLTPDALTGADTVSSR